MIIEELENIQRRAARFRFVTGLYSHYQSVSTLIKELEWDSLSLIRTVNRLTIMYKILNNLIAIDIPPEMMLKSRSLRRKHKFSFTQIQSHSI